MPTLLLEDGTGLANSNSYVSVAEADDYFSTHPYYADTWNDLGDPDKESLLMAATVQLDALIRWKGYIVSDAQSLGWPRTAVIDNEGRLISSTSVPRSVKIATMEIALFASRGDPFATPSAQGLDSVKIDVIELQFSTSKATSPVPAAALLAVQALGDYTFGMRIRKVLVG